MLNYFRKIAFLEGLSLILLLFIAMPVKYILNQEILVKIIGMAHGVLFVIYVIGAFIIKITYKWSINKLLAVCLASIIPFGTFYLEKKNYFKN